jgi:hypothetical protein
MRMTWARYEGGMEECRLRTILFGKTEGKIPPEELEVDGRVILYSRIVQLFLPSG